MKRSKATGKDHEQFATRRRIGIRCAAGGCHVATSQDAAVHHGQAVSEDTGHGRGSCALVTFVGLSGWW